MEYDAWISDHDLMRGFERYIYSVMPPELAETVLIVDPSVIPLMENIGKLDNNEQHDQLVSAVTDFGTYNVSYRVKKVLLPVNCSNSHWILVKIVRIKGEWTFNVIDSLNLKKNLQQNLIIQYVLTGFAILSKFVPKLELFPLQYQVLDFRQTNGYDCGIFLFEWIRFESISHAVSVNQSGLNETRRMIEVLRPLVESWYDPMRSTSVSRSVFLSFAGEDRPKALKLIDELKNKGIDVFWDENINTGELISAALKNQLDECKYFVCLISRDYLTKRWPLWELTYTYLQQQARSITFVPLCLDIRVDDLITYFNNHCSSLRLLDCHSIESVQRALGHITKVKMIHSVPDKDSLHYMPILAENVFRAVGTAGLGYRHSEGTLMMPVNPFWELPILASAVNYFVQGEFLKRRLALVGMSGVGKSTLATIICHVATSAVNIPNDLDDQFCNNLNKLRGKFRNGICWLNMSEDSTGELEARKLLTFLDGNVQNGHISAPASEICGRLHIASTGRRMIVVLDDLRSETQLQWFRELSNDVAVIITSHVATSQYDESYFQLLINCNNESGGKWPSCMLKHLCGGNVNEESCSAVSSYLGNLPKLLSVVGSVCHQSTQPEATLVSFLSNLQTKNSIIPELQLRRDIIKRVVREISGILSCQSQPSQEWCALYASKTATESLILDETILGVLRSIALYPCNELIPRDIYMKVLEHRKFNEFTSIRSLQLAASFSIIEYSMGGDVWMHGIISECLLHDLEETEKECQVNCLRNLIKEAAMAMECGRLSEIQDNRKESVVSLSVSQGLKMQKFLKHLGIEPNLLLLETKRSRSYRTPPEIKSLFDIISSDVIDASRFSEELERCPAEFFQEGIGAYTVSWCTNSYRTLFANNLAEHLTLSHLVCMRGSVEMLTQLINKGIEFSPVGADSIVSGRAELFICVSMGRLDMVKLLLDRGLKDDPLSSCAPQYGSEVFKLDRVTDDHDCRRQWCYLHSIHCAIALGLKEIVELLLDRGAARLEQASVGFGWIDMAITHFRLEILCILLRHLLRDATTEGIRILKSQSARLLRKDLPEDSIVWFNNRSRTEPLAPLCHIFHTRISTDNNRLAMRERNLIDSGGWFLRVKTINGKSIQVAVVGSDTVAVLKQKLCDVEGIPADQQRLIFSGKEMLNTQVLSEFGLQNSTAIVHLVLKLVGGSDY